jgi:hypothetical protein
MQRNVAPRPRNTVLAPKSQSSRLFARACTPAFFKSETARPMPPARLFLIRNSV